MSGHSKWAKVKHVKAKVDAVRGRQFTKVIKEITIAARCGGGDPNSNPRLRTALQSAKDSNMPKDNIERAIKKGTGELEGVNYEEVTYEGYAPGGVAVMARCLTDNTNRTVAEVNKIYSKNGGNMGVPGCVSFMFQPRGYFFLPSEGNPGLSEEVLMDIVLEAGAEDMKVLDDGFEILSEPSAFFSVRQVLDEKRLKIEEAKITSLPKTTVKVTGTDVSKVLKLVDALEEHDDVQDVYYNYDISDEDMEMALGA
ncbi:MAG TPA: YebC/PmpR family DNA-binding transcriptional regulator [Candidatus Riflebacteria bacterium]|jgi:YebC/PmpR family DNA-binding regulatory protein|nr:MAG: YebC/PmpR family DNA-binding transcriptional regulator [Candidatus Riflebacteria bacterium HGW-Riflebacteria-1]HAE40245.1 YebC/PmpR family DNA-binding transcriptional regulator [Candidatus Riflebacteria bacterium]